jgi:hypothetical protein
MSWNDFSTKILTFVGKVLSDGSCQSCFSVINVAYLIIIKYKLTRREVFNKK